jgi:hypothetical protein
MKLSYSKQIYILGVFEINQRTKIVLVHLLTPLLRGHTFSGHTFDSNASNLRLKVCMYCARWAEFIHRLHYHSETKIGLPNTI